MIRVSISLRLEIQIRLVLRSGGTSADASIIGGVYSSCASKQEWLLSSHKNPHSCLLYTILSQFFYRCKRLPTMASTGIFIFALLTVFLCYFVSKLRQNRLKIRKLQKAGLVCGSHRVLDATLTVCTGHANQP